jgi:hypothetical protein
MIYSRPSTLGGPILKDRLWFFGAARCAETSTSFAAIQPFQHQPTRTNG